MQAGEQHGERGEEEQHDEQGDGLGAGLVIAPLLFDALALTFEFAKMTGEAMGGRVPVFEYHFTNAATGRSNKRRKRAFDEAGLRDLLSRDEIVPTDVRALPDDLATEPQIKLLTDRGVSIPAGLTKSEASDLITNLFERRDIADPDDFEIARVMRTEVTRFASKASIYKSILFSLTQGSDDAMLGTWFAYRVYRNAFDRSTAGIRNPLDQTFIAIGKHIAGDARLPASLRRAAGRSSVHFRWFGKLVTPDGWEHHGDGDQSEVYRFVHRRLHLDGVLGSRTSPQAKRMIADAAESRIRETASSKDLHPALPPPQPEGSGMFQVVVWIIAILGTAAFGWKLLVG